MISDAYSPSINEGDLVHYTKISADEIKLQDFIFYKDTSGKVRIQKVIDKIKNYDGQYIFKLKGEKPNTVYTVYEKQIIGKMDYVLGDAFVVSKTLTAPYIYINMIIVFVIPIIVMKKISKKEES